MAKRKKSSSKKSEEVPMNEGMNAIPPSYLFRDIRKRVEVYTSEHSEAKILKLGIGDAVLPVGKVITQAIKDYWDSCTARGVNDGYPPESGLPKLRLAISDRIYDGMVEPDHIFVSTGSKEDGGSIGDIFSTDVPVYITDPVYPVYLNTNLLYGRSDINLMPCTAENDFVPEIPNNKGPAIIWLCTPNNPAGVMMDRETLTAFVNHANATGSILLVDTAYRDFRTDRNVPASVFECDGAQDCAIEFYSFSKSHGCTGLRLASVAFGSGVKVVDKDGKIHLARNLWDKRQAYRTNGVPHDHQHAIIAALTPEGMVESRTQVRSYLENAKLVCGVLDELGIAYWGGVNSPYVWAEAPGGDSWVFFQTLLEQAEIVATPGAGFGDCGEGYIRFSSFARRPTVEEACERLCKLKL